MEAAQGWPDLAGRLTATGHVLPVRVYWEDTDAGGVVYHAGYLRFVERGRTDFLRLLGVDQGRILVETGAAFVVRRMALDFLAPARLDDVLRVETAVAEVSGARAELAQDVWRDGTRLLAARVTVAMVGRDGRPRRLAPHVADALRRAAGGAG